MTIFKNSILPVFFVVALGTFSGCRSEIVIAPGPHCAEDPVEVCHDVQDWHGYWHHECRTELHHHCWAAAKALGNPVGAVTLGREYDVSFDAAQALIDMAVAANHGDASPALKMGLGASDLSNVTQTELPTQEGIDAVAKNLNSNPDAIHALFRGILDETRVNKAAANRK